MKEYHIATVTRNIEKASGATTPEKTAKVSAQELKGAVYFKAESLYDGEYPIPAYPPFGFVGDNGAGDFWTLKVGTVILVEMEDTLDLPDPRYVCTLYSNVRDIHRDFKKHYPYRLGRVTDSGHKLIWDDKVGDEIVNFEHKFGHRIFFDKDGSMIIHGRKVTDRDEREEDNDKVDPSWFKLFYDRTNNKVLFRYQESDSLGSEIVLDNFGIKVTDKNMNIIEMNDSGIKVTDKNTNKVDMNDSGIKVQDKNGNIVELKSGEVNITASGDCNVTASGNCLLNASMIGLNGMTSEVTSKNSHLGVIDLITGAPIVPTTTVFVDI